LFTSWNLTHPFQFGVTVKGAGIKRPWKNLIIQEEEKRLVGSFRRLTIKHKNRIVIIITSGLHSIFLDFYSVTSTVQVFLVLNIIGILITDVFLSI